MIGSSASGLSDCAPPTPSSFRNLPACLPRQTSTRQRSPCSTGVGRPYRRCSVSPEVWPSSPASYSGRTSAPSPMGPLLHWQAHCSPGLRSARCYCSSRLVTSGPDGARRRLTRPRRRDGDTPLVKWASHPKKLRPASTVDQTEGAMMFSVLFEVRPRGDQWDAYLDYAKMLRPELEQIDGFIDNVRYG